MGSGFWNERLASWERDDVARFLNSYIEIVPDDDGHLIFRARPDDSPPPRSLQDWMAEQLAQFLRDRRERETGTTG